ncbi:type II toxin-antitoxin system RelE/ParE family toxin [Arthrobacter sp. 24S4-2]|uniref:type II toxin-antitoxin system RelE/ParE family toxin n=1 Tax=Arthrobacter sp. 24S4-2 TaxID=2575374 RepID=UPI001C2FCFB4|nr:type II toxin-antitoxin system RelE/ParE family toxin [Arthrobacter sp. 24S4-2]
MWNVDVGLVEPRLLGLDQDSYEQIVAALELLAERGPQLGRPLVDTVVRSRHKNMKELRPGSSGRSDRSRTRRRTNPDRLTKRLGAIRDGSRLARTARFKRWKKWCAQCAHPGPRARSYRGRIGPDSGCFRGIPVFARAGTRFESHLGHA